MWKILVKIGGKRERGDYYTKQIPSASCFDEHGLTDRLDLRPRMCFDKHGLTDHLDLWPRMCGGNLRPKE